MRKFMILAASIAALAIPAAAMASVAVDSQGVGIVGKGDVQTALGGIDDAAMQSLHAQENVTFTSGYSWTIDYLMQCSTFTGVKKGTAHQIITTPITQDVNFTANENSRGKLTNGWNLNGFEAQGSGAETAGASQFTWAVCPAGQYVSGSIADGTKETYGPRSGLQVTATGIGTFDLPNTPVEPVVEPVA